MTIVGAYARICETVPGTARLRLCSLAGVTTFDLAEPDTIGLLVEAATLDDAYAVVTRDLPAIDGVVGVWPVFVHDEDQVSQNANACCG